MNKTFLKEEAEKLMQIKGNVKGVVLNVTLLYIRNKKGEEGVKLIEETMKELGHSFKFSEIQPLSWYKEGLSVFLILVAKELFDWTDKDIFDMGNSAPKFSLLTKILIRHFVSLRRTFEEANIQWHKHFDFADLEPVQINEKEKYLILRIKGYKFHPLICSYHAGYFLRVTQYVAKTEKIGVEETKCMFKGDDYHEYLIKWE